ncbi:MAG: siphovirus ReqiPepy6 Gp37-like family protein [Clostridia bacterium]|nr:siphovirus ReqiPepy6 Gp37-like family protein [Clostridia bacterium]
MDLYVMNQGFEVIGIIENEESVVWKKCFTQPGEFEIYTIADTKYIDLLQIGSYIVRYDDDMVGVVEKINIQKDDDGRDMLLVSGRCAKSLFARRIINKQQTFTGTVWNRMYWMLYHHAVHPTAENRQIPNITITDVDASIKGPSGEVQHTGTNLMDAVIELLESNNLGWKVYADYENKNFVVELIAGTDRTIEQGIVEPVIFSDDYDNLISTDYQCDMTNYANVASIAGEGEGSARVWQGVDISGKASGQYAGLSRYEMYVDARDLQSKYTDDNGKEVTLSSTAYKSQLRIRGLEKLAEVGRTTSLTGEVDTGAYTYRVDYNVGDLVTVAEKHGITGNTRIVSIEEIEDGDGYTITPEFSDYTIVEFEEVEE